MKKILAEISLGELADKITILEIKSTVSLMVIDKSKIWRFSKFSGRM